MPCKRLAVVQPEVLQILCLLTCVLEAAEEDDIVLEIRHTMSTPCRGSFAFGLYSCPLS